MADKRVRMMIEFSIDDEALQDHGLSAAEVLKHLTFREDDVVDGFRISTNIPGMSPASHFFLCEGKVVSAGFAKEWVKGDGLDHLRRMVIDEIDLNYETYDLSASEKESILDDASVIDRLAKAVEARMQRGDRNEYNALESVFQEDFPKVVAGFRGDPLTNLLDGLGLFYEAGVRGNLLFIDFWKGDSVEVFLADDGELLCLLPDEDEPRALRSRIQDVEAGDAFFFGGGGAIRTTSEAAHQNFDEPDNPWILYGDDGDCYFEEDFGVEMGQKVKAFLEKLPAMTSASQGIEDAVYVSIWDGGHEVETGCKVNRQSGEVFHIEVSNESADRLDVLEGEYVRFADGSICSVKDGKLLQAIEPEMSSSALAGRQPDMRFFPLKELLTAFDEKGWKGSCSAGDWKISPGGYGLWFELYYKGAVVAQCIDGKLSSKFDLDPSQKKALFDRILEIYDHLKLDPEERKEMLMASFEAGQTFYEVDTSRFITLVGESSSDIWIFDVFDSNKNPLYQTSAYAGSLAEDILSGDIIAASAPQRSAKSSLDAKIQNATHSIEKQGHGKSTGLLEDLNR